MPFSFAVGFRRVSVLLVVSLAMACVSLAQAEPLRLTSSTREPYFQPDGRGFLDRLIPEIFRRAGVEAVAVQYDGAARANINANSGIDDGVAIRSRLVENEFPNLIRVDEKVTDMEFVVFSLKHNFPVTGFESLRPYVVGYIFGWKAVEDNFVPGTAATKAPNAEQLFNLLESGYVDVVVFERWMAGHYLVKRGLKARMLRPPLVTTELFIHLNKKHAHLAAPVAAALRAMKADGSYQRIVAETLRDAP